MSARPPVKDWATDFDHLDPRWVNDPFPIWDEMREECPIAHTDRFLGVYLPTRYEDVRAVAYDTEHFSSRRVVVREPRPSRRPRRRRSPPTRRTTSSPSSSCCRHSPQTRSRGSSRAPRPSATS